MADDMRPATPVVQCGDEAVHGEHEWLLLGAFRSQCPGYVGAVAFQLAEDVRVSLDDLTDSALFGLGEITWPVEQTQDGAR